MSSPATTTLSWSAYCELLIRQRAPIIETRYWYSNTLYFISFLVNPAHIFKLTNPWTNIKTDRSVVMNTSKHMLGNIKGSTSWDYSSSFILNYSSGKQSCLIISTRSSLLYIGSWQTLVNNPTEGTVSNKQFTSPKDTKGSTFYQVILEYKSSLFSVSTSCLSVLMCS